MVLLYNHADPDESFVSMLTDDEIKRANQEATAFSEELMNTAREHEVHMPAECYYA
jgi:hypothetical protein